MVQQTSISAHQPGTGKRLRQIDKVFNCLHAWVSQGHNLCVPDISDLTGIRDTTVHARICDLKNGYTTPEGITYFAVPSGQVEIKPLPDGSHSTFILWTLTDQNMAAATQEDVERIERKIRILFAKRREYKLQIQRRLKKN